MTPPPPADAAAWLARGEALEAAATPDSLGDAVRSYDCAIALLRPLAAASRGPAEAQLAPRRDLAIAYLHRGNALQKLATPEALAEAVRTYDEAVALLAAPDLATVVPALQLLAATWLNRAHALHRQATPPAISAAIESHRQSIAVLENLAAATAITAEDALNRRVNLAAGCMHLANALGVPLIGLFGPTNPVRTGPVFSSPARILQPPGCPPTGGGNLADLTPATVATALRELLAPPPA